MKCRHLGMHPIQRAGPGPRSSQPATWACFLIYSAGTSPNLYRNTYNHPSGAVPRLVLQNFQKPDCQKQFNFWRKQCIHSTPYTSGEMSQNLPTHWTETQLHHTASRETMGGNWRHCPQLRFPWATSPICGNPAPTPQSVIAPFLPGTTTSIWACSPTPQSRWAQAPGQCPPDQA